MKQGRKTLCGKSVGFRFGVEFGMSLYETIMLLGYTQIFKSILLFLCYTMLHYATLNNL